MNYGIPFRGPFTSPFGVPFLGITGGGSPSVPVGALATYTAYSPSNFTLVTDNKVNVWQDEASVTYGSELVTNGDFEDGDTGWTFISASDTGSSVIMDNTGGGNTIISQTITGGAGKYQVDFTVLDTPSTSTISIYLDGTPDSTVFELGKNTVIIYAENSLVQFQLRNPANNYCEVSDISVKQILTGSNDLTQSTSGNQPTLVEDNTVTQFTASNQPTYAKDKQVTQDTLANMPTYDATEGALVFDKLSATNLNMDRKSGDIDLTLICSYSATSENRFLTDSSVSTCRVGTTGSGFFRINSVSNVSYNSAEMRTVGVVYKQRWVKNGNDLTFYLDDVEKETFDVTGESFQFNRISSTSTVNGFSGNLEYLEINGLILDASDPSTMLNDSSEEPQDGDSVRLWHDPSAVDVMVFGSNKYLETLGSSADFVFELDVNLATQAFNALLSSPLSSLSRVFLTSSSLDVYSDENNVISFDTDSNYFNQRVDIRIVKNGNDLSVFINEVQQDVTMDVSGLTYSFPRLGRDTTSNYYDGVLYSFKQWNSADSSGAPDFTLTPDSTKLRTSANANPVLGEDVAKWYADEWSGYRDSRVVFDGTDDNMSGLPPQTGDFTYVFDLDVSAISQTEYIFSGTDSSALLLLSDNKFYLRQSTGASDQVFVTETVQAGPNVYALVREGNDVRWYVNSVLKDTIDVTGRSFNFNTVGANADSMGSFNSLLNVFDRVLTQTEIDYYSYLRSETGEILLPPLLPS